MNYCLIALDLDGTLMNESGAFSPRVRSAIALAQARGSRVTVATGRSYLSTRPFAQDLKIAEPLICYQGGLIVQPDGQVLRRVALQSELAAQVLELARQRNWHAVLYKDGDVYAAELLHPPEFYQTMINPGTQQVTDLFSLLDRDPDKVLLVAQDTDQTSVMYAEMLAQFSKRMQIVRSHALFVEANPPGVDKGDGLAWLSNYLGVPQAQVMAVGDQDNDAPMLAWAGLGVAMGQASNACKTAAKWIAPSLSDDGAAVAIERFVLNPV